MHLGLQMVKHLLCLCNIHLQLKLSLFHSSECKTYYLTYFVYFKIIQARYTIVNFVTISLG